MQGGWISDLISDLPAGGWILVAGAGLLAIVALTLGARLLVARAAPATRAVRAWRATAPEPAAVVESVPAADALARLVASRPDVEAVFRGLGFEPVLERRLDDLLRRLRTGVGVEIPDLAAYRDAVRTAERQAAGAERDSGRPAAVRRAYRRRLADPFLRRVLAALDDRAELLEVLSRDPLGERLPFVEEVPIFREGRVVWRTPIKMSLVRKRPSDPPLFLDRLDRLEALVESARLPRPETARRAVLEAVRRLRSAVIRPESYLPTPLERLAEMLHQWLRGPGAEERERRRRLEATLSGVLATTAGPVGDPALAGARESLRERAQEHAQHYLDNPWMRCEWLTTALVARLLASELPTPPARRRRRGDSPEQRLRGVVAEVASGRYDAEETARRLRELEDRGAVVHSLVYALLRLHRAGPRAAAV